MSARATAAAPAVRPRRTTAPARPLVVPRPRRVSGPARRGDERRGIGDRPARRRSEGKDGIALGVLSGIERLGRRRSLGGRTWIALVAFALIGIVTLQLGLLKLNGGIGRALEHEALLQRENATLSIENSELAAGSGVQARAAQLGMAFFPSMQLRFLSPSSRGDLAKAATALSSAPSAAGTQGSEAATHSSESSQGAESSLPAQGAGSEANSSQTSSESEATSGQSSEAASSESASSGASSAAATSSPAGSGAEASSGASAETGAGGGVQASSPGG